MIEDCTTAQLICQSASRNAGQCELPYLNEHDSRCEDQLDKSDESDKSVYFGEEDSQATFLYCICLS